MTTTIAGPVADRESSDRNRLQTSNFHFLSATNTSLAARQALRTREDALAYLPRKALVEYRRGQIIFDEVHPAEGLYLVSYGCIKLTSDQGSGARTMIGIIGPDDFFGYSTLAAIAESEECGIALEATGVMCWTRNEIEELIERMPRLGIALVQTLAENCLECTERLQMLALYGARQRVALSLLRLANRMGTRAADDAVRIPPFTQHVLAEYVGTSREIVTAEMNRLRREGCLRYSRKNIEVFSEALAAQLCIPISNAF
jgi:CRP-like cAMP-binding protein